MFDGEESADLSVLAVGVAVGLWEAFREMAADRDPRHLNRKASTPRMMLMDIYPMDTIDTARIACVGSDRTATRVTRSSILMIEVK